MRYTTVIDISEIPDIYRNQTARLIYLHMSLRAGYHDADRDLVNISIRRLAMEVGVTVSATRHALNQLVRSGLLIRTDQAWKIRKWVEEQTITARARTKREMQEQIIRLERQKQEAVDELSSQERASYDPEQTAQSEAYQRLAKRFGQNKKSK